VSEVLAALIGGLGGIAGVVALYFSQRRRDAQERERRTIERRLSSRDEALAHVREFIYHVAMLIPGLALESLDLEPTPGVTWEDNYQLAYGEALGYSIKAQAALKALGEYEAAADLAVLGRLVGEERRRLQDSGGSLRHEPIVDALAKVEKHYIDLKGRED